MSGTSVWYFMRSNLCGLIITKEYQGLCFVPSDRATIYQRSCKQQQKLNDRLYSMDERYECNKNIMLNVYILLKTDPNMKYYVWYICVVLYEIKFMRVNNNKGISFPETYDSRLHNNNKYLNDQTIQCFNNLMGYYHSICYNTIPNIFWMYRLTISDATF